MATNKGQFQTYYSTLGISRTATAQEIKVAFRKLAARLHPDVNPSADATENFKRIHQAYQILKDPVRRKYYDSIQLNQHQFTTGNNFQNPTSATDSNNKSTRNIYQNPQSRFYRSRSRRKKTQVVEITETEKRLRYFFASIIVLFLLILIIPLGIVIVGLFVIEESPVRFKIVGILGIGIIAIIGRGIYKNRRELRDYLKF